jgi:hypothetical protein
MQQKYCTNCGTQLLYVFLLSSMNLDEAVELLRVVSAIPVTKSAKRPEIRIVRAIGEVTAKGYTLHIEKKFADADYRNHLNKIAKSKKLAISESKHYLIIYRKSV